MRTEADIRADLAAAEAESASALKELGDERKAAQAAVAAVSKRIAASKQHTKSRVRKLHLELGQAMAAAPEGGGDGA